MFWEALCDGEGVEVLGGQMEVDEHVGMEHGGPEEPVVAVHQLARVAGSGPEQVFLEVFLGGAS